MYGDNPKDKRKAMMAKLQSINSTSGFNSFDSRINDTHEEENEEQLRSEETMGDTTITMNGGPVGGLADTRRHEMHEEAGVEQDQGGHGTPSVDVDKESNGVGDGLNMTVDERPTNNENDEIFVRGVDNEAFERETE